MDTEDENRRGIGSWQRRQQSVRNPADFNGSVIFHSLPTSLPVRFIFCKATGARAPTANLPELISASQLTPLHNLLLFNKADNTNGAELSWHRRHHGAHL